MTRDDIWVRSLRRGGVPIAGQVLFEEGVLLIDDGRGGVVFVKCTGRQVKARAERAVVTTSRQEAAVWRRQTAPWHHTTSRPPKKSRAGWDRQPKRLGWWRADCESTPGRAAGGGRVKGESVACYAKREKKKDRDLAT